MEVFGALGLWIYEPELPSDLFVSDNRDPFLVEDVAIDLIADFPGKCGEGWGHFPLSVKTISSTLQIRVCPTPVLTWCMCWTTPRLKA